MRRKKIKRCEKCQKILNQRNKSGYCRICWRDSPKFKEFLKAKRERPNIIKYQKLYHRKYARNKLKIKPKNYRVK